MKKNILIILSLVMTTIIYAQDQTVNGNLSVKGKLILPLAAVQDNQSPGLIAVNNDDFLYKGKYLNHYGLGFYRRNDSESALRAYISDYFGIDFFTSGAQRVTIGNSGNVGIGTDSPQYKLHIEGDTYTTGWFRVNGNQGLYFQSWGGGFYMTDATWIRTYGNKNFYHNTGVMRTDGVFHVGPNGDRLIVNANANIGIGVTTPQSRLEVAGTIRSKEVKIEATGWSDFVFDKNYDLPKLSDVEKHINEKQHLPGIPSEKEILENGISVGEMQAKLLQKIEELTLYVIGQDKKLENQDAKIQEQQNKIGLLEEELVNLKK